MPSSDNTGPGKDGKKQQKGKSKLREDINKNAEALKKLEDVPDKIDKIFEMMQQQSQVTAPPVYEPDFEPNDYDSHDVDGDQQDADVDPAGEAIQNLIKSSNLQQRSEQSASTASGVNLQEIVNSIQPEVIYGEEVNSDVASNVLKLYCNDNPKSKDKLFESYKVPSNLKMLGVPKVNQDIWPALPPPIRQRDYALQNNQKLASTAAVGMVKLTEVLCTTTETISSKLRDQLIKISMESISALGLAWDDMNKRRKLEIKPCINREYVSMCTTSKSTGEWLFGDSLNDQMKQSKSAAKIVKSTYKSKSFAANRHHPYRTPENKSLNPYNPSAKRGGLYRGRGKSSRGRGFSNNRGKYNNNQ